METLHYLGLFTSFVLILYKILYHNKAQHKTLPPSPPSLPIIGHFHLLKGYPLTQALLSISNHYGPTLFLRFGRRRALTVSTPSSVEECFTKNDVVFANRPNFSTGTILEYKYTGLGSSPYGDHWRNLRRLTALEIFSSARMQVTSSTRAEELKSLVKELTRDSPKKVDMNTFFYVLNFNIMMRLFSGYRYFGEGALDLTKSRGQIEATKSVFYPETSDVLADYFPILRLFPVIGRKKKLYELLRKREDFVRGMIDANKRESESKSRSSSGGTLIGTLLSLQESEPELYTNQLIFGLIAILLVGGTHSTERSMVQIMSHLMSHPDIFKRARDEIDANVPHDQLLGDADLAKLPYLHCIINESLRLGPVGSILPLHESSEDCRVGGYDVPRGTMLFVNAYGLHRDPKVWEDPNAFKPERFREVEGEVSKGGANFIPFGLGRRKCPGWSLAMKMMALTLGTLIQCFEWELCGSKGNNIMGPLEVIFRPRQELVGALSRL